MSHFLDYLRRAKADRVPYLVILARCRNWRVPRNRAADLALEGETFSYGEAFMRESKEPGYFRNDGHFRGWVTNSACWYAIRELKLGNRHGPIVKDPIVDPPALNGEESVFRMCFARLSDVEQRILVAGSEGKTDDEIAIILAAEFPDAIRRDTDRGSPPSANALRLRVFRLRDGGKQRLTDCMIENGEPPYTLRRHTA